MLKYIALFWIVWVGKCQAAEIVLHHQDAVVWHYEQVIRGELKGIAVSKLIVHHNQMTFTVPVPSSGKFSFKLILREPKNKIWVEATYQDSLWLSDTITYTLGYQPVPVIKPIASVINHKALLEAITLENPYQLPLQYTWREDPNNPAPCQIIQAENATTEVIVPQIEGTYYFNLLVVAGKDSSWYQTYVKRENDQLIPFHLETDLPSWLPEAVVYQVSPPTFVKHGKFDDITAKLPELQQLGINTLLLQPITQSYHQDQGYDVIDYFSVNPALGTAAELRHLIQTAKKLGMKVLFDVVLNHTSIHHPYAKDRIRYGQRSHYFDYYQQKDDGKPYSSFYQKDEQGFISYFWKELVNLNYQHEEVQRWMLAVCQFWLRDFDIDGYRFDAIWGVNARYPAFAQKVRIALKSIKPDVLLLAEDKGTVPEVFRLGYDIAYDWTADSSWVSQWSWAYQYHERESFTIFNHPDMQKRGPLLRQALVNQGGDPHRLLRFMENNDLARFIAAHGLPRTKMVAALLFSLPGIPMLYNGQEVGIQGHPYASQPIFQAEQSIQSLDQKNLFPYYRQLIRMRQQHPALQDTILQVLTVSPEETMMAFQRGKAPDNLLVLVNLDSMSTTCQLNLKTLSLPDSVQQYTFRDLLHPENFTFGEKSSTLTIPMKGYAVRWLLWDQP